MLQGFWICQGIGFEGSDLFSIIDMEKLVPLMESQDNCSIKDDNLLAPGSAFLEMDSYEQRDALLKYTEDPNLGLCGILRATDEDELLVAVHDFGEKNYLLYPPRYPWEAQGSFETKDQLETLLAFLIHPYCKNGISMADVRSIIYDVMEIGGRSSA